MDDETFKAMQDSLRVSYALYPHCNIANCKCYETRGEWLPGCSCFGHFFAMDRVFGVGPENWSLDDFAASVRIGSPIKATLANAT